MSVPAAPSVRRIVIVSECFTAVAGYIENKLPVALARLGHEVHLVTSDLQVYHSLPDYEQTYKRFQGPAVQPVGITDYQGVKVHRLPHQLWLGYVRIKGLAAYLRALRPDIVQVHAAASWVAMEAATASLFSPYLLFTGAHQTASAFSARAKNSGRWSLIRIGSDIRRALPGRLVHLRSRRCYAATDDCGDIAAKFYGAPRSRIDVCPLGVDTDLFYPAAGSTEACEARLKRRAQLGFAPEDIVCIYTGRMNNEKNPLCLARAIENLRRSGRSFRGIFVGDGPQSPLIRESGGCMTHEFVPARELPGFYRAADIGVWPAFESLSMLDAAGCGLPIVVSDRVLARERFEGNGLTYVQGDPDSLAQALRQLEDPALRDRLGSFGADKVSSRFGWDRIARRRLADYQSALSGCDLSLPLPAHTQG